MKLNALEKSHLASLAKGEPSKATTDGDFRALHRLVKLGLVGFVKDEFLATQGGKEYCRKAENMFTKVQIAQLHKRIKSDKYWIPKPGELIYTDTRLYIDHGEDDVEGGLAQIIRVYRDMSGGDAECVFVEIAQHDHGSNWTQFLFPDQKELMERFGTQVAYPDPDNYGYTRNF